LFFLAFVQPARLIVESSSWISNFFRHPLWRQPFSSPTPIPDLLQFRQLFFFSLPRSFPGLSPEVGVRELPNALSSLSSSPLVFWPFFAARSLSLKWAFFLNFHGTYRCFPFRPRARPFFPLTWTPHVRVFRFV